MRKPMVAGNWKMYCTLEEARTLLAFLQADNGKFESVGLVPPIVEPGDPDYPKLKTYLQLLRRDIALGQPATTVETVAPDTTD